MNMNILHYSVFGIAGGQEVDHIFVKFIIKGFSQMVKTAVRIEDLAWVKNLTPALVPYF